MVVVGQNKQQSNLSVFFDSDVIWKWDLLTYYSLENFFGYHEYTLKILINVLMSLLDWSVASPLRGGGE